MDNFLDKHLLLANKNLIITIHYGENIDKLKEFGDQVIDLARVTPHTNWVRSNYGNTQQSLSLAVKNDETAKLGLSRSDIANTVAMNVVGVTATQIWDDDYPIDVKVKTENTETHKLSSLKELSVIVPQLRTVVPLRQVADLNATWNEDQIVRRNGRKCLTIRVDIEKGVVADGILKDLRAEVANLDIPRGIEVEYGGEFEMQQENLGPMGLSLLMSVIIIFLILLWHFKSLKHAFLSFMTMPLSIFGAALGLILLNYPFSFTSFMGILALCGIVVRNGIILIDFADEIKLEHNLSVKEAAIQAAQRRMRPIFLTSSAAAVGVIPMILSRSSLWGPLGTVIAFGLMMSMVLTLFVLPVLYWLFFRNDDEIKSVEHA